MQKTGNSAGERREFAEFAARKTREAAAAYVERLSTVLHPPESTRTQSLGNAWTRIHYGGNFSVTAAEEACTALSLVFVQSKDGNTGGTEPAALGGGATDTHLIYEGLSRVAADAVLVGAGTVHRDAFFTVWHPEIVSLRNGLGLPRHPAQIVISRQGRLNFDARLFNVPDVPVFVIAGENCLTRHAAALEARPWIRRVPLDVDNLRRAVDHLRNAEGIRRISAIGGRFTASRLVDAGLAQDLYLTTAPRSGGEPGTPWYSGTKPPSLEAMTRKEWPGDGGPVVFEHIALTDRQGFSSASQPLGA
jgi:riboflavin biosynthesis pyrimidine reductase